MKKKLLLVFMICLICLSCSGCGSDSDSNDSGTSEGSSSSDSSTNASAVIEPASFATSVAKTARTYDADDIVENASFDYIINIDFSENTVQLSSGDVMTITTVGVTPLTVGSTDVTVAHTDDGITIQSTVNANIRYNLTGTLAGTLTVSSANLYQLYLNTVTINGSAGPALDLESSEKVFIVAASGTTNTLTDSATRSMTMKAAVYGNGPMIIGGEGTINVRGSYKHGIFSEDYIRVDGAKLNVTVSAKDAVRSVNGFIFDEGNLTISATGTVKDDESKGIIVEGAEGTGTNQGYIVVNGGYITITSVGKAITAGWDIDEDATTSSTSDDPDPYVIINNGVITITTTGTPYEYMTAGGTVSCSPEGIEAKSDLTINNGYLIINTTDDAMNSGNAMTINGGYIYCNSSVNDAVDTNGKFTINGGVMVAIGSRAPEGPFDCDVNTFAVNGGTFVGIGGTVSRPTAGYVTQNLVVLGSLTKGSTMALKAGSGSVAFAFTIPQSYATMIISSPEIDTGTKYTVYTGGTASADNVFKGLYLGSLGYSGGTAGSSFTVSSKITKIGGAYF